MRLLRRGVRGVKRALNAGPVFWLTVYLTLLGMFTAYGFWVDSRQDVARCKARNDATQDSVHILAISIIEAAGADQEDVDRFQAILDRNLERARVDC